MNDKQLKNSNTIIQKKTLILNSKFIKTDKRLESEYKNSSIKLLTSQMPFTINIY